MSAGADQSVAFDPPGAIGLPAAGATLLLRFDEDAATATPQDTAGNLADMGVVSGITMPPLTDGACGRARSFSSGVGLVAADLASGSTLLTRDMTIQVILRWSSPGQVAYGTPGTIYRRGYGFASSSSETVSAALLIDPAALPAGQGSLYWEWEDVAGVVRTQAGAAFAMPSSGLTMLTATRRWVSPTSVVLRYYVGDVLLGEVASSDGSIGGATIGTTQIGCAKSGGGFGRFLVGAIDELLVLDRELTREEIEATWLRITRYQPLGRQLFYELHDPGFPLSEDPGSDVQLDLRITGHALGYAAAQAENVRANILPQRAYGSTLEDWEQTVRVTPQPRQDIDTRRARVLARIRQRRGCTIPGIGDSLVGLLGGAEVSDLEFIAFNNEIDDGFMVIDPLRWDVTPAGAVSAVSGSASFQPGAGTFLFGGQTRDWITMREIVGGDGKQVQQLVKLVFTTHPVGSEAGVYLENATTNDYLAVGVRNVGGVAELHYESFVGGISGGQTLIQSLGAFVPIWIHAYQTTTNGTWKVKWSLTSGTTGFSTSADITHPTVAHWSGLYLRSYGAIAAPRADFDNHRLYMPFSGRAFNAYVMLDRAFGFSPDIDGADSVISAIKHAFTHAAFITNRAMLADDPDSGCGLVPCGGYDSESFLVFPIIGDSNASGPGVANNSDAALGLVAPFPAVPMDSHIAPGVTDPPVFASLSGALQPYTNPNDPSMGIELTMGRALHDIGLHPAMLKKAVSGATLATEFHPDATFPTVGPNLYSMMVSDILDLAAQTGNPVPALTMFLGTNDASTSLMANAYQGNCETLISRLRDDINPDLIIAIIKININSTNPYKAIIAAAQEAIAAADSRVVLVRNDLLTLTDGFHYGPNALAWLGDATAILIADAMGIARRQVTGAPVVVGWGSAEHGAGPLAPQSWPGTLVGDIEIMPVATGLAATPQTLPSGGWAVVSGASLLSTVFGLDEYAVVYWRPGSDGGAATSVPATNSFEAAKCFTVRGATAIDIAGGGVNNAFDTVPFVASSPGSTAVPNELILEISCCYSGSGTNGFVSTNAGLTGERLLQSGTYAIGSDYQVIAVTSGIKAAPGAIGAATMTSTNNGISVGFQVALRP